MYSMIKLHILYIYILYNFCSEQFAVKNAFELVIIYPTMKY